MEQLDVCKSNSQPANRLTLGIKKFAGVKAFQKQGERVCTVRESSLQDNSS